MPFLKKEIYIIFLLLVGGFIARLYKVDSPLADWHSWRQADTASVARIYVESGINLLYPRYHDISSVQSGLENPKGWRFVEFPIYSGLHAFLAKTFPILSLEKWGRILTSVFSLVSALVLYFIGKRFLGFWGGVLTTFFFLFIPYNIYFSRVILPDPVAVAFGLLAIYFFSLWIDEWGDINLYLSVLFLALGLLIKPFVIFYTVPLFYLAASKFGLKELFWMKKLMFWGFVAIAPFVFWRIWASQYPQGIPYWDWAFNGDRIRFKPAFWRWLFGERIGKIILAVWGMVPFTFGILQFKKNNLFIPSLAFGSFLYMSVWASGNVRHDYYQIFIIPALALLLANGTLSLWNATVFDRVVSRILLIISIIFMFGFGWYTVRENYKVNHPEIILAGLALDKIAPKDALVVAPYNADTAFLYQTKRQGWPYMLKPIEDLVSEGADYYLSVNFDPETADVMRKYEVLEQNKDYVIVDLNRKKVPQN